MSKLLEAREVWQKVIDETVSNKNTGLRVGGAGLLTLDAILESVNPNALVQIDNQIDFDAFRPQSGFAIVTMNSSIDHEIRNIFGTDNKVEIHAYTVAGTGSNTGNCYQDGVSAISGITYRRSYNILTGWTNFVGLVTDISRKIDFIDWYDLGNVYSVNKGDIIRVTNNNHYKWYIVIQDYIGSQSNVDFTDSSYYFDITDHKHIGMVRNRGYWTDFWYGNVEVNDIFYTNNDIAYICIQRYDYSPLSVNPPDITDPSYYKLLTYTDVSRRIPFIDWSDLNTSYSVNKGDIIRVDIADGDYKWYIVLSDYTGDKNVVDYTDSEVYFDITGHKHKGMLRNRGYWSAFIYGLVEVNDIFYLDNDIAYICIQSYPYSPLSVNPPDITDPSYYKLLTYTDVSRRVQFIDWSDLNTSYSVNKGDIIRVDVSGGDYKWYIVLSDYTGDKNVVDYTNSTYYFDITGHTHDWVNITGKPSTYTPSVHNHLNDTLKPNVVEYQSGATVPTNVGSQYYDDTYKVLSTVLGNGVVLQNGLEMYVRIVNKTGVQLNDGQAVYISGAQGNRPTATLAIATSEQASYVIGVCTENIANNQEGFVTVFGTVNGYNTSSFTDGAKLYLSATVAGGLTMTRPVAPNHGVIVGIALNSTNNGAIFVNPNSGFELSELHDVDTTKTKSIPLDADYFLMQDTADSNVWKKVLKSKTNEVSVGSTAPTNNEVLWVDTTSVVSTSFQSSTSATISPDFLSDKAKFTSNYAGGNTVAISGYTNLPAYDCEKILIIKNTNGSDRIFVPTTTQQILGGITYNWIVYNTSTITVPTGKYLEISYEFNFTSATTCDVTILWVVQG